MTNEEILLKKIGDLWRPWLGDEAYNLFIKTGYYSKKHPNSNLRIIATNCMYCDTINFYLVQNPSDPMGQVINKI